MRLSQSPGWGAQGRGHWLRAWACEAQSVGSSPRSVDEVVSGDIMLSSQRDIQTADHDGSGRVCT